MTTRPAPIIAVVLLLLPVLYVGSYLALVVPGESRSVIERFDGGIRGYQCSYRLNSRLFLPKVFYPLEQIDRRLRPGTWNRPEERIWRGGTDWHVEQKLAQ